MGFCPGQRVEFIATRGEIYARMGFWEATLKYGPDPEKGRIYTVEAVHAQGASKLLSLVDGPDPGVCWSTQFFRPVVEDQLELLRRIAERPPQLADAPEVEAV